VLFSRSLRVGGNHFNEDIIVHLKHSHNLLINKRTSEQIKIGIGSAFPLEQELTMEIKGRDLSSGQPKTLTICSEEIRGALKENLSHILLSIRISLERCPPELVADVMACGIMMTGGGSLLRGIDQLVAENSHLLVHIADNPKALKLPQEIL
jgi:rod shape-determining protein MreB